MLHVRENYKHINSKDVYIKIYSKIETIEKALVLNVSWHDMKDRLIAHDVITIKHKDIGKWRLYDVFK